MATNTRLLFNKVPIGYPVAGETTIVDESERIDLNTPLNGGVLIKVVVLSIDPYLRGRMRKPGVKSYSAPFTLGGPIENYGVGIVLRSEHPRARVGDHLYGIYPFQTYTILSDISNFKVLLNTEDFPWSVYLGVLGMPGQTAYIGWKLYSKAKKGETVFVTTAAGPVGSCVVQIAKSQGLKVIASAGSDDKVAFVKELGADVAFNYKTQSTREALNSLGHGIDIYWDHVGGEMLEAALDVANDFGRIIICGAISRYNTTEAYGIKNMPFILLRRLTVQGFIASDHFEELLPDFYEVFPPKVARGEIKYREQIYKGLEGAEQAIVDVQKGENVAKCVALLEDA